MSIYIDSLIENTKYHRWYLRIISNAKQRASNRREATKLLGYCEQHHIVPKCLQQILPTKINVNDKENLVFLTGREHFVCHLLLCRIYPNDVKLKHAVSCFRADKTGKRNLSSREIAIAREYAAFAISISNRGKKAWNKGLPHSDETRKKISEKGMGRIPWNKGINPNKHIPLSKEEANELSSIRMKLHNPMSNEALRQKVKDSAISRAKSICCLECQRLFDPGNFSKHKHQ
jgi:hypothetical protein